MKQSISEAAMKLRTLQHETSYQMVVNLIQLRLTDHRHQLVSAAPEHVAQLQGRAQECEHLLYLFQGRRVAEPDYKAKYIELLEQQAAPKATQDVPTGTPAATDSAADPFALSDEQKQLLTTYNEEWPEVSKAEALRTQIIVHTALAQFANQ